MLAIAGVIGRDTAVEGNRSVPRAGSDAAVGGGEGGWVVGKDQLDNVGWYCEGSVSQDDWEPLRGACFLNGSGSSLIWAEVVDLGRYGAGRGGTGGTDSRLPKGVAGLNQ